MNDKKQRKGDGFGRKTMKQCQYCGAPMASDAIYCYNCAKVTQGVTPPPVIETYKRRKLRRKRLTIFIGLFTPIILWFQILIWNIVIFLILIHVWP